MPLTEPNMKFHTPVGNVECMVDIIEALCGGVGSIPSTTLWTVVDSWDGTTRQVPTGNLLANSTTAWAPGGSTPPSGSWIVLECQPGERSAVHQSKWTVSGTTAEMQLIPYADWTPGGGTGAAPTIPSRVTVPTSMNIGIPTTPRAIVWDESMVAFAGYAPVSSAHIGIYLGEVHAANSEADDPRPFVHVRLALGGTIWDTGPWVRYSPFDDTTLCTATGYGMVASGQLTTEQSAFGTFLHPVRLSCTQASHRHFIGTCRHIANISHIHVTARTTWGLTLGVRDWMSQGPTTAHLALRHDGTALDFDEVRLPLAEDLEVVECPVAPGIPPVINFVTAAAIASTDPVVVEVTDDVTLGDVTIEATYIGGTDIIYSTPFGFNAAYTGSSATPIAGGYSFSLVNDNEWYENFTLSVHASDDEGLTTDDSLAYTVTGGYSYPSSVLPGAAPVINWITAAGALNATDTVTVEITDDLNLLDATIWVEHATSKFIIYANGEYSSAFAGSIATPITGGFSYELACDPGWYEDMTIFVTARDEALNSTSDSRAWTVADGTGVPVTPEVPDVTAPILSELSPADLANLKKLDPIFFNVTDDSGYFLVSFITASYASGLNEVIYDGRFSTQYAASSTKASIPGGYRYSLRRAGGWPAAPLIKVTVFDRSNNPLTLSIT